MGRGDLFLGVAPVIWTPAFAGMTSRVFATIAYCRVPTAYPDSVTARNRITP
jgi:hypothetical protein